MKMFIGRKFANIDCIKKTYIAIECINEHKKAPSS